MKIISDYLINSYFSKFKALPENFTTIKKITFTLIKLRCETGLNFAKYLNLIVFSQAFEYIFLTFKPKKDYNNDYLRILSFNV